MRVRHFTRPIRGVFVLCERAGSDQDRNHDRERVQYQRLLRTPYGIDEWRTICLTPWHNRQGLVDGFITTALDVHELQVTMNALRAANQRLSSHMENSPLAVLERGYAVCLTPEGKVIRSAAGVELNASVKIRLHEGTLRATVSGKETE